MSKVQTVFDFLAKVSIGIIAAAAYVESVADVPDEVHAIAAILVIACNAFNVAVQAVEDKEKS